MSKGSWVIIGILYLLISWMIYQTFWQSARPAPSLLSLFVESGLAIIVMGWMLRSGIYAMLAPWWSVLSRPQSIKGQGGTYTPFVSVVIPAYNEAVGLTATIKTVLASSYQLFEVIVVNDGSTDETDQIMQDFLAKYQRHQVLAQMMPIYYYHQRNQGKGAALNTGIHHAHGDIIVTIDADSVLHPEALAAFVKAFADPTIAAAAGTIQVGNTSTFLGLLQAFEYCLGFYTKRAEALLGTIFVLGGACAAFRRSVLLTSGGYQTGLLTEDLELSFRLQAHGWKISYVPEAHVFTEAPATFRGLFRQRVRWKQGRLQSMDHIAFYKKHPAAIPLLFRWIYPLAMIEDALFLYSFPVLGSVFVLSFWENRYLLVILPIAMVAFACFFQVRSSYFYTIPSLPLMLPVIWYLLAIIWIIEAGATITAYWRYLRNKEGKWNAWNRQGAVQAVQGRKKGRQ